MATEPISKLLGTPELQPIAARLEDIKRLQRRYRAIVPESLAQASRVCAIDGTVVVVGAANGPWLRPCARSRRACSRLCAEQEKARNTRQIRTLIQSGWKFK